MILNNFSIFALLYIILNYLDVALTRIAQHHDKFVEYNKFANYIGLNHLEILKISLTIIVLSGMYYLSIKSIKIPKLNIMTNFLFILLIMFYFIVVVRNTYILLTL